MSTTWQRSLSGGLLFLAVTMVFSEHSATAAESCGLSRYASLNVGTAANGMIFVPMKINGHDEKMLVNTAASFSALTEPVVSALNLPRKRLRPLGAHITFGSRTQIEYYAIAQTVQFDEVNTTGADFLIIPDAILGGGLDGMMGSVVLTRFDVEIDFMNGKLNLFAPHPCPGVAVYWSHGLIARVRMRILRGGGIVIPVELDGKKMMALLSTSSKHSAIGLDDARDAFDWQTDPVELKPVSDSYSDSKDFRYPFKTLTFDGVTVSTPDVAVMPRGEYPHRRGQPELILGIGVLRQLHIYIAYDEGYLYATSADAQ